MTSIRDLWDRLQVTGPIAGAQRVDAVHDCDLYAAFDGSGRPGLLLITDGKPPPAPSFEAVEIVIGHRSDGRWATSVWLANASLRTPFTSLCNDVVDALRRVGSAEASGFLLAYLIRWRRLLAGGAGLLPDHELRGLLGEISVLGECLDHWSPSTVLHGWVGPHGADQDIVVPGVRIEVKTARPGAATVRISSLDQLDAGNDRLMLAVVTLAPADESDGRSAAELVGDFREKLSTEAAYAPLIEFETRLQAAGYDGSVGYERVYFRLDEIRYFRVENGFPRLVRATSPAGVADASYDLQLGLCAAYECVLEP